MHVLGSAPAFRLRRWAGGRSRDVESTELDRRSSALGVARRRLRPRRRPATRRRPRPAGDAADADRAPDRQRRRPPRPRASRESRQGHLDRAREEFDRALDVYLTAPGGAYADPGPGRGLPPDAARRSSSTSSRRWPPATASRRRRSEPASIDDVGDLRARAASGSRGDRDASPRRRCAARPNDLADRAERRGPRPASTSTRGRCASGSTARARARRPLPAPDPRGVRGRRHPAGPGLRRPGGERLQDAAPSRGPRPRACGSSSPRPAGASACAQDWWVDERSDPEKATRAAAQLPEASSTRCSGTGTWPWPRYNAGEGQVGRAIEPLRRRATSGRCAERERPGRGRRATTCR